MKILLIGGGSGGHITPLLAVARELKKLHSDIELLGVCEKGSRFVGLYKQNSDIDSVHQILAGKYRRYEGISFLQKASDIETFMLNGRDVFRTMQGYRQAIKLLKQTKPDGLVIKGGFVAVPMGMAAAKLKIPFITHDSDSSPGLANRIISRWATIHATGMPVELYNYPKSKTVYTGIPVSADFVKVTPQLKQDYREKLQLSDLSPVLTIVGGSQGAEQLNKDVVTVVGKLMEIYPKLGVIHVAGEAKQVVTQQMYDEKLPENLSRQVQVKAFVGNIYECQGAADVVITRASATMTAELALQNMPIIVVPGQLADGHQDKNARYFADQRAALVTAHGDGNALYKAAFSLLEDPALAKELSGNLGLLAKPAAAYELAELALKTFTKEKHEIQAN